MIIDGVVLVIVLISCVVGFFRGFIREVLTIIGLVLALYCAYLFGDEAAVYAEQWFFSAPEGEDEAAKVFGIIPPEYAALGVGYVSVFFVVFLISSIVTHFMSHIADSIGLGALDRSLGVVFGIIRAFLLIGVIFVPIHSSMDTKSREQWFGDTITYPYLKYSAALIQAFLPDRDETLEAEKDEDDESVIDTIDPLKIKESFEGLDIPMSETDTIKNLNDKESASDE